MEQTHDQVKEYYGKTLQKSEDLKTNACCTIVEYPDHIKRAMALVHTEVEKRYYGCGLTIPHELEARKVLDLGSGSGRDCFILSKLVGQEGYVVGVDMTDEQLAVARDHIDYHTKEFGYSRPNIEFKKGHIEKLDELDLADNTFDIIVSNCVINLSPDKEAVLREAFRVLKEGGELYFSDVYADRRISQELVNDPELYGECLSGALYWNDFLRLARKAGFSDPRLVEDKPITISNKALEEKVGTTRFFSATYRLFKISELEDNCEDYGQAVIYKGTIPASENIFRLDAHHFIEKGKIFPVCANTYHMLKNTRFEKHFEFVGDMSTHYGIFEGCGSSLPFESASGSLQSELGGSCC